MPETYDQALKDFEAAEKHYREMERRVVDGEFIQELLMAPAHAHEAWQATMQNLRDALEERNVKLKNVQDALRQKVALAPTKWRGPDGKPTLLSAGPFRVSSVTKRTFDANSLFRLCQTHGLYERLMELKTHDKDGKERPLVKQEWDIDYENVLAWLKANNLNDVIDGAYDEKESTPQVKGPKRLAFLGDTVER